MSEEYMRCWPVAYIHTYMLTYIHTLTHIHTNKYLPNYTYKNEENRIMFCLNTDKIKKYIYTIVRFVMHTCNCSA